MLFIADYEGYEFLLQNNQEKFRTIFSFLPNEDKRKTLNDVLLQFFCIHKRTKNNKLGCPFYQPSTMNAQICTLFSAFKTTYGHMLWVTKDFDHKGGFVAMLKEEYYRRTKVYSISKELFFFFLKFF